MKTFKLIKTVLMAVVLCTNLTSCNDEYDDSEIWNKVNSLDDRITQIESALNTYNENIASLNKIVKALQDNLFIKNISSITNGYKITFSDGSTATITNGEKGEDAPIINVAFHNGRYYWTKTTDGITDWLYDSNGNMIPASGIDGKVPLLEVDDQGYWTISYDDGVTYNRMLDKKGNPIKAVGNDGDSFFKSVVIAGDELIMELADGTEIIIPLSEQSPYKAIDLGLSVRWASFNVGAKSSTEAGGLYLWGDANNTGIIPNYKAPDIDNICGTEYDIARSLWGGTWRMPTQEEQVELIKKCTWTRATVNGVKGMKVTGSNGNSIFLPPTGYRVPMDGPIGSTQLVDETSGRYWVGEAYNDYGHMGYCFYFNDASYYYNGSWNTSFVKMAVRAVKK